MILNPSIEHQKMLLFNQLEIVKKEIINGKYAEESVELLCKIKKKAKELNINLIK